MRQRGFTLVEIMIAVALVGVLVGLAVVSLGKKARKTRGAEAHAVFAALRVAQEQYHLENGSYLSSGANETDTWPVTPNASGQDIDPLPASWTTLKVRAPVETVYCSYVTMAGDAGDGANLGAKAAEFGLNAAPATDWYYILARCDLDRSAARDSYYFTWSGDTRVQKQNEGH